MANIIFLFEFICSHINLIENIVKYVKNQKKSEQTQTVHSVMRFGPSHWLHQLSKEIRENLHIIVTYLCEFRSNFGSQNESNESYAQKANYCLPTGTI